VLFVAGDFLLRALGFHLVVIAMTASTLPFSRATAIRPPYKASGMTSSSGEGDPMMMSSAKSTLVPRNQGQVEDLEKEAGLDALALSATEIDR